MISSQPRQSSIPEGRTAIVRCAAVIGAIVVALGLLAAGAVGAGAGSATAAVSATQPTPQDAIAVQSENVSEEAYVEAAPERGDEYYEATDPDGDWISYINPRDEYRNPYLGDGSGKICVTLLNEAGEPIVGETVPDTRVIVPTGDELSWHSHADPMIVEFPLTEHYERPLDADQFGTSPDVPQGDGYMDTHCIEMHGNPEDATIEYGEAAVEGEHADEIEVVGYIQQQPGGDGWDTDIDPIEEAEPYEAVGGSWTYEPDASHGQVVVVMQLDRDAGEFEPPNDDGTGADDGADTDDGESDGGSDDGTDGDSDDDSASGSDEALPGMSGLAALVALAVAALFGMRR